MWERPFPNIWDPDILCEQVVGFQQAGLEASDRARKPSLQAEGVSKEGADLGTGPAGLTGQ